MTALLYTGKVGGAPVAHEFPFPRRRATLLARGQERYNIYCSPCHDRVGSGNGMIVQRGFAAAVVPHERLRAAPVGYFFEVITNGFGAMPSYAAQVPARDRWAIVAYIRALQLSQHATLADVPARRSARSSHGADAHEQRAAAAGAVSPAARSLAAPRLQRAVLVRRRDRPRRCSAPARLIDPSSSSAPTWSPTCSGSASPSARSAS